MKIKEATILEIDELAYIFHEYREISVSHEGTSSIEESKSWLHDRINGREAVIFIAIEENSIVGFSTLYKGFSSISLKKYWVLNDLYVVPNCRGKGYAKHLISEIQKYAIASGSKGIEIETARSNKLAQALYESFGYEENNIYKRYFWHAE